MLFVTISGYSPNSKKKNKTRLNKLQVKKMIQNRVLAQPSNCFAHDGIYWLNKIFWTCLVIGALTVGIAHPVYAQNNEIQTDLGTIEKMTKSDEEWKKELGEKEFNVLREEGTERPFTSELLEEHREGTYVCAACGLPLFKSSTKFNSGTGWPSFFEAIEGHVETKTDYKLVLPRTEYHCARCGGHQGHVFEDGPQPTGLRYCNNGVSLKFKSSDEDAAE